MRKQTLLVVDDERSAREGLVRLFKRDYHVVAAESGATALALLDTHEVDVMLCDVRMPGMDGLEVQSALNRRGINMPVIILTGHGDVPVAVEAMKGGAIEFLEKPYEKQALVGAIESAFNMLDNQAAEDKRSLDAKAKLTSLTPREMEVLDCLVTGLTNKGIAQALSISPRTVEIHRAHLMEKLEADSLSTALRLAFLAGMGGQSS